MTASNFERALSLVLKHEGSYVDHPSDPGGATNMGITIATLKAWRGKPVTKADVKNLTRSEAAAIYRANYWNAVKGDDLPLGLDYAVFDFAVNSGVKRAVDFLQACLKVTVDGKIGPETLRAAKAANARLVVDELCDRRLAWLKRLKTWPTFGKGWAKRVEAVRKEGVMAAVPPPPDIPAPPRPAPPVDAPASDPVDPWWVSLLKAVAALFRR